MKTAVFSTKSYDEEFLREANQGTRLDLDFFEERLGLHMIPAIRGAEAICTFVNDPLPAPVLDELRSAGIRFIALRCAGFNQVDVKHAESIGIHVTHVPAYSPHAVAEFALSLILTLNRRLHRAYNRVRDGNFSIDGLLGFDMHGSTVGVLGTGKIGVIFARLLSGFGVKVLGSDPFENPEFVAAGGTYVPRKELLASSDIISLHCPLTPDTFHVINAESIELMKDGVMIINTSRGALVDALAVIEGLKSGRIGYLGLDVYEQEADVFYENLSEQIIQDDVLQRLVAFPNVLITSHQAYFTFTAMRNIAKTTIENLVAFRDGQTLKNAIPKNLIH